ncbi:MULTISPECIES: hypothetical protein [unclassified Microbacterium]|uniref:hypothetical protein n=1 Tax=unclassified Microbacterium TaxID=2609290 RepID=UPI00386312B2
MSTPVTDQRRLGKFLARAEPIIANDAIAQMGDEALSLTLTMTTNKETGESSTSLSFPSVPEDVLWNCITRCRVFFVESEDCYLPKVARAIYNLAPKGKRAQLQQLVDLVDGLVIDGNLVGALMYSGRLEMDNGVGPGKLLGSDQMCMDYIYGVVLHEDEERRARLNNIEDLERVEHAVLMQMANLLRLVTIVRDQTLLGQANGWLPVVEDTLRLNRRWPEAVSESAPAAD